MPYMAQHYGYRVQSLTQLFVEVCYSWRENSRNKRNVLDPPPPQKALVFTQRVV